VQQVEIISMTLIILARQIYNWIKKQVEWAKHVAGMKVLVLCPYGDWTDGTVIGITYGLVRNFAIQVARSYINRTLGFFMC
jgi:hypothetical protein